MVEFYHPSPVLSYSITSGMKGLSLFCQGWDLGGFLLFLYHTSFFNTSIQNIFRSVFLFCFFFLPQSSNQVQPNKKLLHLGSHFRCSVWFKVY